MRIRYWSSDVCSSDLFGFMETPDVPLALMHSCDAGGIHFDPMDTTYFASRETVVASRRRGMPVWRDKLFAFMHRNAAPATGFFQIGRATCRGRVWQHV